MEPSNKLSRLIRKKKPAVGLWINLCDPEIAHIAAVCGYDWVMIDMEHNPLTEADVQKMIYVLHGYDVQPIVRIRNNQGDHYKWVLDCGAGGVVVPGVKDASDAMAAVRHCKYSPLGERGYGPNRVSDFFTKEKEYVSRANEDILLICQIELNSAVREIDEICQIPGIDGLWIGPTDLAQSLGHIGNAQDAEVQAAVGTVIASANRSGMSWGIPTGAIDMYNDYVQKGGRIMVLGSDTRILRTTGTDLVKQAKERSAQ